MASRVLSEIWAEICVSFDDGLTNGTLRFCRHDVKRTASGAPDANLVSEWKRPLRGALPVRGPGRARPRTPRGREARTSTYTAGTGTPRDRGPRTLRQR